MNKTTQWLIAIVVAGIFIYFHVSRLESDLIAILAFFAIAFIILVIRTIRSNRNNNNKNNKND